VTLPVDEGIADLRRMRVGVVVEITQGHLVGHLEVFHIVVKGHGRSREMGCRERIIRRRGRHRDSGSELEGGRVVRVSLSSKTEAQSLDLIVHRLVVHAWEHVVLGCSVDLVCRKKGWKEDEQGQVEKSAAARSLSL